MKTKLIIAACSLFILINSCSEEFLNLPSPSSLTLNVYFKSQADYEAGINGIYSAMRSWFNGGYMGIGDLHSDNLHYYMNPKNRGYVGMEAEADFVPDIQRYSNLWSIFYSWIARTNQVLDQIDDVSFDQTVKDNLKGQALFMRAYSYLWLVKVYGKAVIHLKPVTSVEESYVTLSSESDVIAQVIEDATLASTLLKNKATQEPGRVTSGTAKMILADVYMWRQQWSEAEIQLTSLAEEYSLMPEYTDVTNPAMKNNAESIFEIQFSDISSVYSSGITYGLFPFPMSADTIKALTGVSNPQDLTQQEGNLPTPDLISSYEPGDKRFNASIKYVHDYNGVLFPMCIKYLHPHNLLWQTDDNMPVYRYAEALLFLAEAINEQGGRSAVALGYLNQIRNRAGLTNSTATTQEQIRDAIAQERRVELAFEGKRWFDLVRTGKAIEVITAYGARVKANTQNYYFPIGLGPVPSAFTNIVTMFNVPEDESLYNPSLKK
jgi:hypothetical protein